MSDDGPREATTNTYHCYCTTLIVATTYNLEKLPPRASPALDGALILPLPSQDRDVNPHKHTIIYNLWADQKPIIVRREDGFEKRTVYRCNRCKLVVGYKMDETHFRDVDTKAEEVLYILPGGLVDTRSMTSGRLPEPAVWTQTA